MAKARTNSGIYCKICGGPPVTCSRVLAPSVAICNLQVAGCNANDSRDRMEPATARIPARSHRQAMDWSLVLVSQGIEALIENPAEGAGWGLVVGAQDYARALEAIRQYRLENREGPVRQEVFRPGFLFDWGSSGWAALVAIFFWLSTRADLRTPGSMDSVAVAHGLWWRLFTAIWLHADLGHLISNLTFGFVLIGLAMGRYGSASESRRGRNGHGRSWSAGRAFVRALAADGPRAKGHPGWDCRRRIALRAAGFDAGDRCNGPLRRLCLRLVAWRAFDSGSRARTKAKDQSAERFAVHAASDCAVVAGP